jgi:hypothetical protein
MASGKVLGHDVMMMQHGGSAGFFVAFLHRF